MSNPLAEVFGYPIANETDKAQNSRTKQLCPFNNTISRCTKARINDPLGVCSIYHRGKPVIVCPVRFREDWLIVEKAASFFFSPGTAWTSLGEVRLKNKDGGPIGNIDYVLVSYDDQGQVLDFASLEVQAVYISGNLGEPFDAYTNRPTSLFDWSGEPNYPTPDYLSSSKDLAIKQKRIKAELGGVEKKEQLLFRLYYLTR